MKSDLSIFSFFTVPFVSYPRNHCQIQYCEAFIVCFFFPKSFVVVGLTFRFLIYFALIFVYVRCTRKLSTSPLDEAREAKSCKSWIWLTGKWVSIVLSIFVFCFWFAVSPFLAPPSQPCALWVITVLGQVCLLTG